MKVLKVCIIVMCLGLASISCNQYPIFVHISTETAPIPPLIEGSPTNMVVVEWEIQDPDYPNDPTKKISVPVLYVASGKLYWYAKNMNIESDSYNTPQWNLPEYDTPQAPGRISSFAVAKNSGKDRLYALCLSGSGVSASLWYIDHFSDEWKEVEGTPTNIQSIYADPDTGQLFAGAGSGNSKSFSILYLDNTINPPELKQLIPGTSILSGVVSRDATYYLSTIGDGIFPVDKITLTTATKLADKSTGTTNDNRMFMNIIKLEDETIIAIERNGGTLYEVEADGFKQMRYTKKETITETDEDGNETEVEVEVETDNAITTGRYVTGALTTWKNDATPPNKLLIAGIQRDPSTATTTSSYTYGYVEFTLKEDGSFDTGKVRHDADGLESVDNPDRYKSSLGTRPINHLFQTPYSIDTEMTFFASTQTEGLWSYRYRDNGGRQWNGEQ